MNFWNISLKQSAKNILAFTLLSLLFFSSETFAQELLCRVQVQAPNISGDQTVFKQLEKDIYQYMNNRKWTNDNFEAKERIKCTMTITFNSKPGTNRYEGLCEIRAIRPVLNSSYETLTLLFQDKFFNIDYVMFQTIEFSENTFTSNLASLLNFYAYMIIGADYDSFSANGGTPYYQKAQSQMTLAANSNETGWQSFDATQSRYWLVENLLNNSYKKIRDISYRYHRRGLDVLSSNIEAARSQVMYCLKDLKDLQQKNPGTYIIRVFMDTKASEMANIFSSAPQKQQAEFLELIETIDPAELENVQKILKGK